MTDLPEGAVAWPASVLRPLEIQVAKAPFTATGGRALNGVERVTQFDTGLWNLAFKGVPLGTPAERRMWNMLGTHARGRAGLLVVPAWSFDSTVWPAGTVRGRYLTPHSDGTSHSDGTRYAQPGILLEMAEAAALGAPSVVLRAVHNIEELSGIRFSYAHALYETGFPSAIDGDEWTVPVFPPVRAPIPAGADLEVALPTCLVRLATDREMDSMLSRGGHNRRDVSFVEAVDYWDDLALA